MDLEYDALMKNKTCSLVPYSSQMNLIGHKLVSKSNKMLMDQSKVQGTLASKKVSITN